MCATDVTLRPATCRRPIGERKRSFKNERCWPSSSPTRHQTARRYGRLVNVSSIAALGTALPGTTFYAATKAEVAILTKRFAMELGSRNITVNAVAPGFVRTHMTRGGRGANDWQGTEERFAARAMIGRIGEPEDIANAVAFLASPESQAESRHKAFSWLLWSGKSHIECLKLFLCKCE